MAFEWLPVKWSCCNGFGHLENDCRKKKEIWQAKNVEPTTTISITSTKEVDSRNKDVISPPPEPAHVTTVSVTNTKEDEPWITPRRGKREHGKQHGSSDVKQKSKLIFEQNSNGRTTYMECQGAQ